MDPCCAAHEFGMTEARIFLLRKFNRFLEFIKCIVFEETGNYNISSYTV